ncbi:MAG: DUF4383 domain-containing protein [Actinobacteria bacterium]|nr:DUF4383 domain-containing protein [Actinomycetota bacterium]
MNTDRTTTDKHPAQYLALAIGAVYTLVGLAGFFVTGFDDFINPEGSSLLGFQVNPLHNVVHLLIGAAGLALWNRLDQTRAYGWLLAIGYGATFLFGAFVAGSDQPINFLALDAADNGLHIASALAGLVMALWAGRAMNTTTGMRTEATGTTTRH